MLKYFFILIVLFVCSCSKYPKVENYADSIENISFTKSKILKVPFIKQSYATCGPTSLTECLLYNNVYSYKEHPVDHNYISNLIRGWNGCLDGDLLVASKLYGFKFSYLCVDINKSEEYNINILK